MDVETQEEEGPDAGRRHPQGRIPILPVVAVATREDMAVMLAVHHLVLRDTARRYLGRRTKNDMVERCVGQTVAKLLAMQEPSSPHGMRMAAKVLWEECRRAKQRQERIEAPVDRFLGPLTRGPVARALERLGPRQRTTILLAGQGLTPTEIARIDHSTPASVKVRLWRARSRVRELLVEAAKSSASLFVLLPPRLRGGFARLVSGLSEASAPHTLATAGLVPLIACSLLWSGAVAPAAPRPAPVALAPAHGTVRQAVPAIPAQVAAVTTPQTAARVAQRAEVATPAPSARPARVLQGAAAETPEDVVLGTSATPPDGRPVIVALGRGNTCACQVLMQSLDGGATWTATDGPPVAVNQIVLPPTYPIDPRIFFGVGTVGVGPFQTVAFGQPYRWLKPLPPGQLAVSAHFDDGDPRIFSAGATSLWSVGLGASGPTAPHQEIDYSYGAAESGAVAALATPSPVEGGPAVLAWAPPLAVVPGSPAAPPLNGTPFFTCSMGVACASIAALPDQPWQLISRGATVVAYTYSSAFVSHDGGASFVPLALPLGAGALGSIALTGRTSTPWVSFGSPDGSVHVARMAAGGGWIDATDSTRRRDYGVLLISVGADRVVAAYETLGYRCALVAGGPWMPRCPTA